MSEAGQFAMWLAIGAGLVTIFAGPVGAALARRLTGGKPAAGTTGLSTGEMTAERVAHLEDRIGELERVEARMAELEERVDFAERLLAAGSGEGAGRLPPAGEH